MREMSKSDDVHMVRQQKAKQKSKFQPKSNMRPQAKEQNQTTRVISPQETCGRCGNKHSTTEVCKAKGKKCNYCRRRDHFERICKFKHSVSEVNDRECDSDESADEDQTGSDMDRRLTKDSILKDYSSAFKGIDLLPGECTIHTDSNMQPVVHPHRRVPIALKNSQTRTRSYGAT